MLREIREKKASLIVKIVLAVILYSLSKASFSFLGKLFGVNKSLIYRWIKEAGAKISQSEVSKDIKEVEIDEMWHFIRSKNMDFQSGQS